MNIKDLPTGSYTPMQTPQLNVHTLPTSEVSPVTPVSHSESIWSSLAGQVTQAVKGGAQQVAQAADTTRQGGSPIQGLEAGLQGESGIASILSSPLAPLFNVINKGIDVATQPIQNNPAVQKFAASPAGETTTRVATDLANAGNITGTILGADKVVKGAQAVPEKMQSMADTSGSPVSTDHGAIVDYYTKAIKPSVVGKKTPQLLEKYNTNVVSGIQSIADNKANLTFMGEDGTPEEGRTPHSVAETAQAIDQTKAAIFNQYNALTKAAGEEGIKISAQPLVEQLDKVVNSEALQLTHPEAVSYAKALKLRLMDSSSDKSFGVPKEYDPSTVQDVIKNYNNSLEAFYRNPSFDNASKAAIDAGVVHTLRQSLADAIESSTGEDYAGLKKQYGALLAIESDVAKRATVLARQHSVSGSGGMGDYAQIFSGGDMVHGLLSLNPSLFAKGIAQSALTKLFAELKSPDRAIKNMFNAVTDKKAP